MGRTRRMEGSWPRIMRMRTRSGTRQAWARSKTRCGTRGPKSLRLRSQRALRQRHKPVTPRRRHPRLHSTTWASWLEVARKTGGGRKARGVKQPHNALIDQIERGEGYADEANDQVLCLTCQIVKYTHSQAVAQRMVWWLCRSWQARRANPPIRTDDDGARTLIAALPTPPPTPLGPSRSPSPVPSPASADSHDSTDSSGSSSSPPAALTGPRAPIPEPSTSEMDSIRRLVAHRFASIRTRPNWLTEEQLLQMYLDRRCGPGLFLNVDGCELPMPLANVDRIDNFGGCSLDNVRLIFVYENLQRGEGQDDGCWIEYLSEMDVDFVEARVTAAELPYQNWLRDGRWVAQVQEEEDFAAELERS